MRQYPLFPQKSDNFLNRPNMIANARFHRWRHAQAFWTTESAICVKVALFPFGFLAFWRFNARCLGIVQTCHAKPQHSKFKLTHYRKVFPFDRC